MTDLHKQLKELMGYTQQSLTCQNCIFFKADDSTDNFGSGHRCTRNPDVHFQVIASGSCKKFKDKKAEVQSEK